MKNLEQTNNPIYLAEADIVSRISQELGEPNDVKKGRIALKSLFQVLRENLPAERSRHLMSLLPNPVLVTFVEGWRNNQQSDNPFDCVDGMIEAYRKRRSETRTDQEFSTHQAAFEIQTLLKVIKALMPQEDADQLHEVLPCEKNRSFNDLVSTSFIPLGLTEAQVMTH